MDFINGLPYLQIRPFTDHEWLTLPHVLLTSDEDWDPSIHDIDTSSNKDLLNSIPDSPTGYDFTAAQEISTYCGTSKPVPKMVHRVNLHLIQEDLAPSCDVKNASIHPSKWYLDRDTDTKQNQETVDNLVPIYNVCNTGVRPSDKNFKELRTISYVSRRMSLSGLLVPLPNMLALAGSLVI